MKKSLLLWLTLISQAHAADLFSPVAGDLSLSMLLQPIFGSLFGGTGDGPLGESIMIFNTCCLTIGGLLAAYTMVFGTMQTAHEGEMLGKKWSSMWIPIRLAIGTAALVPLGSYCAAQWLVGWLTIQGIGLADSVFSAFANSAIASQNLSSATAGTANVSRLAFGMLRSQVCMAGFQKMASEGDGIAVILPELPTASGDMTTLRRYGMRGLSATQCGGVVGSEASGGIAATTGSFFGINSGAAESASAIRQAHAKAAAVMENDLAAIARVIVNGESAGAGAAYAQAVKRYQDSVAADAKGQMGDQAYFNTMAENASRDGWLLAGAWFMRLSFLQDSLMKALADSPTALPIEKTPESMANDMDRYYAALNGALRDPSSTGIDNQLVADRTREDSESGLIMSAVNSAFNKITDGAAGGFNFLTEADAERHPLIVASNAGHKMIWWGLGLAAASVFAAHIGGFTVAMVLGAFVMALIGGGISLAYLLPMLPFIIFTGATAGWLLLCFEAAIGAPLWAVAHLYPRGEEFHGGASAGYMLLLELTLKPVLMIFGFCFAALACVPLGQFITKIFYSTFQLTQGGFVGFVGMLAAMGIYSALMISMMKFTFSFIHKVPDQIMKWMGGGHGSGLSEAAGAAASAEHQSGAVVGAISGAVAGGMSSKLNQMSQKTGRATGGPASQEQQAKDFAHQVEMERKSVDASTENMTNSAFEQKSDAEPS